MKIWHVGADPSPNFVNGVSRTVWLMSVEQARLGHEVALPLDDSPLPDAFTTAADGGITLHNVSGSPFHYKRRIRELLDTFPPDIVHMHSVFIPRQAVLADHLREMGIPYVVTPHAGLVPQVLATGRLKKSVYTVLRERPRIMGAAAIALVTPAEEKAVRSYVPRYEGLVRWMPNPVDFSGLDPHRWHGPNQGHRLIFLGRFDVLVKGIDILLEIGQLLPDVQVDLYGSEDPKTLQWLNRLRKNQPPNVTFHQPVFGRGKAQILAGASMYIQPSRWEGFPVSVAECMYLGVPSSIADTLDLAQLFREQELGLVLSLEPQVAAGQVREALADRARLETWSQRGREFAIAHFAPQAVAQSHIDLYREVIDRSRPFAVSARLPSVSRAADGNGHALEAAPGSGPNGDAMAARVRHLIPVRIRGALKQNVSRIVQRSTDLFGGKPDARSVVLCYHSIHPGDSSFSIRPEVFRQHLIMLKERGFEFSTFGDFVERVMRWGSPHDNVAVITFDDGYEDNFTIAAPVLSDLNIPATFFLTSGLVQGDQSVVEGFRRLTRFDTPYLMPPQIKQMYEAGFEIGAHTHTHPNLRRLTVAEAREEITTSKSALEDILGEPVRSFAYPFGKRHIHYAAETVDLVRESGYRAAAAVAFRGVNSRKAVRIYEIPRFFIVRNDSLAQFCDKISGALDWLGTFQELSPAWIKSLISPEDRY